MKRTLLFLVVFLVLFLQISAQSSNVDCANAFLIDDPMDYCSGGSEFGTTGAGGSEIAASDCFEGVQNDLWFRFTAIGQAVNVVVNGEGGGNLSTPRVVLYEGACGDPPSIVECVSTDSGPDIINLFQSGLIVGETYLLRVGGAGGNNGSFQLCVNNFNPPVDPGQDADDASVLCDKSGFVVQTLSGGGDQQDEGQGTCLDVGFGNSENQSSWIAWVAANDGTLTFTITPLNEQDDIDFVLYELPNGVDDFDGRISVRCMASGCPGGGPTGLNLTSTDLEEQAGCPIGNDNFVAALNMEAGKAYGLLINNFTQTGIGIGIEFGGTGEFQGPEPEFSIVVDNVVNPTTGYVCDKQFEVIDESSGDLGAIIDYEWNFGEDAVPQTVSGLGPFNVEYLTTGKKFIVLTVTSDLGCRITEIREIDVEACCSNPEELMIDLVSINNIGCGGNDRGSFTVEGSGGFPEYAYSFMGGEYSDETSFSDLEVGDYEIAILDRKGCERTQTISIVEVLPVSADAGPDVSIEYLGDSIQLDGSFDSESDVNIMWSPNESLRCSDGSLTCIDPIATPLGTTTYTLTVTDADGCSASDEVVVEVEKTRPLYAPNIFSPNDDGFNDIFSLAGNPFSVANISELNIYDRWGNLVYIGRDLSPTDASSGWDGRVNGKVLGSGVYLWFAKLEFLNPEVPDEVVSGDLTLIR